MTYLIAPLFSSVISQQKNQEQNVSDKNSRTVIKSRRAAIRNYINKFQDFYNTNFVCDCSNPIDQLLFYYKKEMSFHGKFIYSYFIDDTPNKKNSILHTYRSIILCTPSNTSGYENKIKIQNEYFDDICSLLKLGLNLPNVFSRTFFCVFLVSNLIVTCFLIRSVL